MTSETNELARYLGYQVRSAELADLLAQVSRETERTRSQGGAPHATSLRPIAPRRPSDPSEPRSEMLLELHRAYAADGDPDLRTELAAVYDQFALAVARRFHTRRESTEDLAQVARIGLLHAIDRFDPALERPFTVFARATIVGELKRHVRDRTWVMRVPRSLQEHYLEVVRAADDLAQELGRSPAILEVAERTGLSEDHVLEAMELGAVQRPAPLDAPLPDGKALEPGTDDPGLAAAEGRVYLMGVLARLPDREREILHLRFVDGLTQTEIGARIGVSQMYVSRMLARTLTRLRARSRAS
ncbi:MAG: sigma-70 family RNA polymerase sigma factor [Acidimicrobiia bacterium]